MRWLMLVLVLVLAGCQGAPPVVVSSPAPSPSAVASVESLEAYVRRAQVRQSYGLYMMGKKVGWGRTEVALEDGAAVVSEEFHMRAKFGDEVTALDSTSRTVYALEGDGEILSAREETVEDGATTTIDVKRSGAGLEIVTRRGKEVTKREIPMPKDTVRQSQALERWLAEAKADDKFSEFSVTWDEDPVVSEDVYTFVGREEIIWGGVPTKVLKVKLASRGMVADALLRPDGVPWKAEVGGLIQLVAEDEATARKLDAPVDMLAASAVPVDRALPDPERIERLVLDVQGAEGFNFPTNRHQQVVKEDGGVRLDMRRDYKVERPAPLTAEERAPWLKRTAGVDFDEKMAALARKIAAGARDPVEQATRLSHWVYQSLEKTSAKSASSAQAVLANKAGDCTEHTLLFVALARSMGIPARETGGLAYADKFFAWHAWAEIHDGRQWVSVDPTWDEVYVDPTHIQMQQGENDYEWTNVMGRMKLSVVSVETE